jgi:hypothetical protein
MLPDRALSQPTPPPGVAFAAGFQPGSRQLFALDLSGTPVGESPSSIKLLKGNLEVVIQGGVRMLKASSASEFLVTLAQVLPADFTLEFDLIPKSCCPPPDLTFEGTPTINQGPGSAHLLWQADGYLGVVGGAQDNYETPMPDDLRATLPGVRTQVGVSFSGSTVKLYTNGRRLYTLDRQFARGQVLRVFLGGESDANPVYLAGLRIATGGPLSGIVQTPPQRGPRSVAPFSPPGAPPPPVPPAQTPPSAPAPASAPGPVGPPPSGPGGRPPVTPVPPPPPAPSPPSPAPAPPPPSAAAPVSRYRVVALGVFASRHTFDNVLNFDGVEDEIFLATVVNATDRSLSSSYVTTSKSSTFGDVAGFPNRLMGGRASPNGGIFRGDLVPTRIDLNAPPGILSQAFPLLLWEGPLDDQGMVVLHPTLWEEDKGVQPYIGWITRQSSRAKAGYAALPATQRAIQSLRDAEAFGPGSGDQVMSCINPAPSPRIHVDVCIDGEDRPIGLAVAPNRVDYWLDDRLLVLTKAAIEKSLQLPPSPQGTVGQPGFNPSGPGVIALRFTDAASQPPFGFGDYYLYLRVERAP